MKTASAYIIYTPLDISLSVDILGGSLNQRYESVTGQHDPDRSITPLVLKPRLYVVDADHLIPNGDKTTDLVDCRWYESGTADESKRITLSTAGYSIGENGSLTVNKNVQADKPVNLFFTCAYIDPRGGNVYRKEESLTLSCTASADLRLSVELDAPANMPISPYKNYNERIITARVKNGETPIEVDGENVIGLWEVYDSTTKTFREASTEDIFIKEITQSSVTIERNYIDKEFLRYSVHHVLDPNTVKQCRVKMYRWYGQWDYKENIMRGRFLRPDTDEIEVKCHVENDKGHVDEPAKYFDLTHYLIRHEKGVEPKVIGYGESIIIPASMCSRDSHVVTTFGVECKQLTALRPACIGDDVITDGESVFCLSVPEE